MNFLTKAFGIIGTLWMIIAAFISMAIHTTNEPRAIYWILVSILTWLVISHSENKVKE